MFRLFAGLFGSIAGNTAVMAAVQVAFFMALKFVMAFLIIVVLAIVLHNFLRDWITDLILAAAQAYGEDPDASALQGFVIELTGIAAYLGNHLKLQESFAILMAGFSVGAVRSFIPFMGK